MFLLSLYTLKLSGVFKCWITGYLSERSYGLYCMFLFVEIVCMKRVDISKTTSIVAWLIGTFIYNMTLEFSQKRLERCLACFLICTTLTFVPIKRPQSKTSWFDVRLCLLVVHFCARFDVVAYLCGTQGGMSFRGKGLLVFVCRYQTVFASQINYFFIIIFLSDCPGIRFKCLLNYFTQKKNLR